MDKKTLLMYSALLHDVGKIISRSSDVDKHQRQHGTEFMKQFSKLSDKSFLENIYYHDKTSLQKTNIDENSLAYIIAMAKDVAEGIDSKSLTPKHGKRKNTDTSPNEPLHSIFNVVHQDTESNDIEQGVYPFQLEDTVLYPTTDKVTYTRNNYKQLEREMIDIFQDLPGLERTYFSSLLQWTEKYWAHIPHDVQSDGLFDISVYDHSKITCALAMNIYDVLEDRKEENYRDVLFSKATSRNYYEEDLFLLTSLDMSGIQNFIYSISGENALKSLRTRSFYIELMLEVIVDELLRRLELPRTNLLYTGGGHAYLLLPNTKQTQAILNEFYEELKLWFLKEFTTDISASIASVACSSEDLMNTNGKYSSIWRQLTTLLEEKKFQKYTIDDLLALNEASIDDERECSECLRSDTKIMDGRCRLCNQIIRASNKLRDNNYFVVSHGKGDLQLPFDRWLTMKNETEINGLDRTQSELFYSKNNKQPTIEQHLTANLWMCDYDEASRDSLKRREGIASYAVRDTGIKRLGVMRADIDDLGSVFIQGIPEEYQSISRTATLSRQLSLFFKVELSNILADSAVTVIYSGGDDIFLIGAWDELVHKAVEIREAFAKFTTQKLTFSAGIGLFRPKFPVAKMAELTGDLEESSKQGDKNQLTLWYPDQTYNWEEFDTYILQEKVPMLHKLFAESADHGRAFAYKMLSYFRESTEINIARFAYLLARSNVASTYADQLFAWIRNESDRKQLVTALEYYIYETREVD